MGNITFDNKPRKGSIRLLTLLLLIVVPLLTLFLVFKLGKLSINLTASMPIGLYQQQTNKPVLHVGDIVSVCLPDEIAEAGLLEGYLETGHCPSGAMPVVKTIIALPHQLVVVTKDAMIVDGKTYPAPRHEIDRADQAIREFIEVGHYVSDGVWLYGSNAPDRSWDSRYYGAVPLSSVEGVYQPLFTF